MSKAWGLAEALAHFGAKSRNRRSIWSGRSADGNTVVLALWRDFFHRQNGQMVYDDFEREQDEPQETWMNLPGNRERLENLLWARDHCDGNFRVVVVVAKNGSHSEVAECYPQDRLCMHIEKLDEITGRFRAVQAGQ